MRAQSRKGAVAESAANLVVGFSIAYAINYLALSVFHFAPTAQVLFWVGATVTVASVIRSYCWRRIFEALRIRKAPPAFLYIVEELAAERHRQISGEGYDLAHDDGHLEGQLADAAAAYCMAAANPTAGAWAIDPLFEAPEGDRVDAIRSAWPWDLNGFKPEDRRRCLVKAGAMIVAEIGRLDRAALQRGIP